MSRKRCIRRVWSTNVNTLELAKMLSSKLTPAQWNEQVVPVQVAVDELSRGNWNIKACWQPMFECLNRIESLLKLSGQPHHAFVDQAQAVFVCAMDRKQKTGATSFKAPELAVMREMVLVYGDLLKEATQKQFAAACAHTDANMVRIRAEGKCKDATREFIIEPTRANKQMEAA